MSNSIEQLKDALLKGRNAAVLAMPPQSGLTANISKLETIAGQDCGCPRTPKCRTCIARDYLGAISRMVSRGLASIK